MSSFTLRQNGPVYRSEMDSLVLTFGRRLCLMASGALADPARCYDYAASRMTGFAAIAAMVVAAGGWAVYRSDRG
jgi:hypothetical protein